MKNHNLLLPCIVSAIILLCSCGGKSNSKANDYFGEFPSMQKQYIAELDNQEQSTKEITDLAKAEKLFKENEQLKSEMKSKVEEYVATNPFSKPIPFEPLAGTKYTVKNVSVNLAQLGNLNLKFAITINSDIVSLEGNVEESLSIYYKAVDSKGMDIPGSITVASNATRANLIAGTEYEAFGSWNSQTIAQLEDFAKIIEIKRDEYDKK